MPRAALSDCIDLVVCSFYTTDGGQAFVRVAEPSGCPGRESPHTLLWKDHVLFLLHWGAQLSVLNTAVRTVISFY